MVTFRIHTLSLVFLAAWIGHTNSQTCESNQQNEEFLGLLKNKPAAAINLVSDYDHTRRVIPEARGLGGFVTTSVESPTVKFPPVGATINSGSGSDIKTASMTVSGAAFGNGVTTMTSSGSNANSKQRPFNLFLPTPFLLGSFWSWSPARWKNGIYYGSDNLDPSYKGDWFAFKSPECFIMQRSLF